MSKRDELIAKYAEDIRGKIGEEPDMDLLTKVTIGCGPSIYNRDSSLVSSSDQSEKDRVKTNYLMKKLGLPDSPDLDAAIDAVLERYGSSNPHKHRAVVYYLLCKQFGKQSVYG